MASPTPGPLPLEGVKVADFSWIIAGPMLTKYLAIYGADVVKVEAHVRPDRFRLQPPFLRKPSRQSSLPFADLNPSKRSLGLNLGSPEGVEVAKRLAAWADVVVENFSPGQMESWGLGYERLREISPRVVMLSSSQLGQKGPQASHPGIGNLLQALAGVNHVTGWPDRDPRGPAIPYPDMIAPWFSVISIVAALDYRDRTGKGQHLDLSQIEATLQFFSPTILDFTVNGEEGGRRGNRGLEAAPHGVYPCRGEDTWCAVSVRTDAQWDALATAMGGPAWTAEPRFASFLERHRNAEALDALIGAWTAPQDAVELQEALQAAGVPAAKVNDARDLHEDPQLVHRGHFTMLDHPRMGDYPTTTPAFDIEGAPPRFTRAPLLGEHTVEVCRDLLGMGEDEIDALRERGVLT